MGEVQILTLDDNGDEVKNKQIVERGKRALAEDVATAMLGRMRDLKGLKFAFLDSTLTPREKLEALIELKTAMLVPSLSMSLGLPTDPYQLQGSISVLDVLSSIEDSVMSLIKYEETEVINFSHIKIMNSYKMLFELIVEIMQEEIKDNIILNNIIEKVAVRCVGVEAEFNKVFKNVSNRFADLVENPLTKKFKNRDKDIVILLRRLAYDITKINALGYKIDGLEEFLDNVVIALSKEEDREKKEELEQKGVSNELE